MRAPNATICCADHVDPCDTRCGDENPNSRWCLNAKSQERLPCCDYCPDYSYEYKPLD